MIPYRVNAEVEVNRAGLRDSLQRMATLATNVSGPAAWSIGGDGLTLSWAGMTDTVAGAGRGTAVALLHRDLMRRIERIVSGGGTIRVAIAGEALQVGPTSLTCERRDTTPPQLLAMNARPVDVLRLHVTQTPETLEHAGIREAVDEARQSLQRSSAAAAKALAWLDVGAEDVQAWILGRLAGTGGARPQIVVVDGAGQVALFDEGARERS
ncbi:MAG: hypothetical protein GY898_26040 [Proteobacteria bacterium]|nr:hypothetical protein [Pseudomonadota bacterium]